ncbi:non-ribosomal peptide synthetase [Flavobacterium lipolyticum]|uniref:Amino acid adenylation domain-containing protein n=1 Tax=Flavobacterium lipolyticum TaxID=2893754 RepID=A0ABS8M6Y4_9FLAO|nr:non-ribosomal peptide synthetase [Flavobacterium sp. F-126]MCC9020570.1 amino acid adenylation domain-containing protein [Flavobacterium sp. F-126]
MKDLIDKLQGEGILLELIDNKLKVFAEKSTIAPGLIEEIKKNREELTLFLLNSQKLQASKPVWPEILKTADLEYYPLSSSQYRMWVLSQMEESSKAYNVPALYTFEGNLNVKTLEHAFQLIIERHEILRTRFVNKENTVVQKIIPAAAIQFQVEEIDLRNQTTSAEELINKGMSYSFDLERELLLKSTVYQTEDQKWIFFFMIHHIISDGWSMGILINELLENYTALEKGENVAKEPLTIQYKEYAVWQQKLWSDDYFAAHKEYWLSQISGEIPKIQLPFSKTRPVLKTYNGDTVYRTISKEISTKFKKVCLENESTLFMGLLATLKIVLYKYTNQTDLIVGSPIAGRELQVLHNQLGLYLNTIALRGVINAEDSFESFLKNIKESTLKAYNYQSYPFDKLIEEAQLETDLSRNPLFDIFLILQNNESTNVKNIGDQLTVQALETENKTSKFDLLFNFVEVEENLELSIVYNTDLYDPFFIEQITVHFEHLLNLVSSTPSETIENLSLVTDAEKKKLVLYFNATQFDKQVCAPLNVLFEEQVEKLGNQTALRFKEKEFTFQELNEKVNQLAHYLREEKNIKQGDFVVVKLPRSEQMIVALMAIIKAGGAYIPVEPQYPEERINFIITDSQCKFLIDEETLANISEQLASLPKSNPENRNKVTDLAYVLYTSGSTGNPKGCMITHEGVTNRIDWMWNEYNYSSTDVILQKTTFTFDVSVWEIFMPLCWGSKMVLCEQEDISEPHRILNLIQNNSVTSLHFVPSMLNTFITSVTNTEQLADKLSSLRAVITSGEALTPLTVNEWYNKVSTAPIYNLYGPTEASIDVTFFNTNVGNEIIPIGKPIWNTQIYILSESDAVQPIGVAGEICIAGKGLALGYLNNPELTHQKFVPNPFQPRAKMYRTGDLGLWLPDGNVAYLGRKDFQVKIRGFRIELEEIEAALNQHPQIQTAVVLDHINENSGDKYLTGYIVANGELVKEELNLWLGTKLPTYMIPSNFVVVNEIPLTNSGKADRNKLRQSNGLSLKTTIAYVPAQNELEQKLVVIWEGILNQTKIGILEDFFTLGGHSLSATHLANSINREFNVKINLRDIFENRNIQSLAKKIAGTTTTVYQEIKKVPESSSYLLSSGQRRLWLLSHLDDASIALNMYKTFTFTGVLDISVFATAFLAILKRHESLRTVFRLDENGIVKQYIKAFNENLLNLTIEDFRPNQYSQEVIDAKINQEIDKPFNLEEDALLRLKLYQIKDDQWMFSFVMHHIISDGLSMNILTKEFVSNYQNLSQGKAITASELKIQYKDYAQWQTEQFQSEEYKNQLQHWLKKLEGEVPVLDFPTDKSRAAINAYDGDSVDFTIERETFSKFKNFCESHSITVFTGLLSLVKTLLYKYTHQQDITIGTPIGGRIHTDLEDQIGLYINTVPLRTVFNEDHDFISLLHQVEQSVIDAQENQMVAFDELVLNLDLQLSRNRHPLFDVWFVLRDNSIEADKQALEIDDLQIAEYDEVTLKKCLFDLVFNFIESEGQLEGKIEYKSGLYVRETIVRLISNLKVLLHQVLVNADQSLAALPFLNTEEENLLLHVFNDTARDYSTQPNTLIGLFQKQVLETPEQTALVFEDKKITYQELDEVSNKLGNYLKKKYGIKPNEFVGVKLDRSEWNVISLLGILKSGGVYVPIDIAYPEERIDYIIENSDCKLVIDSDEIYDFRSMEKLYSSVMEQSNNSADDLAYLIYTSGSTGLPKGVSIKQGAISNTILSQIEIFGNENKEKALQLASFSFDASISEIFTVLASGGELHIITDEVKKDTEELENYIEEHAIHFATISPSYLKLLQLDKIKSLKKLVTAGEAAPTEEVKKYLTYGGTCFNAYGPTETSICATIYKVNENVVQELSNVPIGFPIANTKIYILGTNEKLLPLGAIGEIYVSGAGLAEGYLNKPELTNQKFIDNPFAEGEKLYKTGDLGKWLLNGTIEYAGRNDDQVKVRGFRIELGEIETVIKEHEAIEDAVVVVKEDSLGIKETVAFFVLKADSVSDNDDIKEFLEDKLPEYMIPSHFISLKEFPLTLNGKTDKKKLLQNKSLTENVSRNYLAPRDETESKLAALWEEVLEIDQVGVLDDFFKIGGHSLKATYLITRIKTEFNAKLDLISIFNNATLGEMAAEIKKAQLVNAEVVITDDFENISL